jgi:hypothetical protein
MSDLRGLAQLDEQGLIDEDIACARCDYNLRTMTVDGTCPECGMIVSDTLQQRLFDRPRWLRHLAIGAALGAIAMAISAVCGLSIVAGALELQSFFDIQLAVALLMASSLLGVWAGWLLSTTDRVGRRWYFVPRCLLQLGFALFVSPMLGSHDYDDFVWGAVILSAGILWLCMHMSRIAATWLARRRLASHCRVVGVGLAGGLVAAGYVTAVNMGHRISDVHLAIAWMFFCTFAVLAVPVLWWFRRRCMQAAKRADLQPL